MIWTSTRRVQAHHGDLTVPEGVQDGSQQIEGLHMKIKLHNIMVSSIMSTRSSTHCVKAIQVYATKLLNY